KPVSRVRIPASPTSLRSTGQAKAVAPKRGARRRTPGPELRLGRDECPERAKRVEGVSARAPEAPPLPIQHARPTRPIRSISLRVPPRRRRADGALQLALCTAPRRRVRAAD